MAKRKKTDEKKVKFAYRFFDYLNMSLSLRECIDLCVEGFLSDFSNPEDDFLDDCLLSEQEFKNQVEATSPSQPEIEFDKHFSIQLNAELYQHLKCFYDNWNIEFLCYKTKLVKNSDSVVIREIHLKMSK